MEDMQKNNENISFSRFFNIRFFSHNCSNNTLLFWNANLSILSN